MELWVSFVTFNSVKSSFYQHSMMHIRYFGDISVFIIHMRYFHVGYKILMKTKLDQMGRKMKEVLQLQRMEFQVDTCCL